MLSFAGRLELLISTLNSYHIFWTAVFHLPKSVLTNLEQLMGRFLWNRVDCKSHYVTVSWKSICRPKSEGGLGIRSIKDWSEVLLMKQFFRICSAHLSPWVNWVRFKYLARKSIWEVQPPSSCS
eukprot:TRINITY_DN6840_c0_g1_i1.p1 TRINITY_DN6840_c0_g1~~TRINITY_DN6840_c0_g1_i1.p1  ORF type:complete len:124 (-),score=5.72 TRINITY_DN6840_c0_g1_i1:75-446(-)